MRKRLIVNFNLIWGVYVNNVIYDIDLFVFVLYYKDIML